MRITVEDASTLDLTLVGMGTETELRPKTDGDGNLKTTEDGRPIYAARQLSAVRMVDGVPQGADTGVTIGLVNVPEGGIVFGRVYKLTGKATVVHYIQQSGNRSMLAVSITADGVEQTQKPTARPEPKKDVLPKE